MKPIRTEPFFQITIEAPFLTQIFPFFRENNLPFETGFLLPEKLTFFLPELKQFFFLLPTLRQQMPELRLWIRPVRALTLPSGSPFPEAEILFFSEMDGKLRIFLDFSDAEQFFGIGKIDL